MSGPLENLRTAFKNVSPAAREDLAGVFENVAAFFPAAATKRQEIAKNPNLSPAGAADEFRKFLGARVVPEMRRARSIVETGFANLAQSHAKLGGPNIDPTDTLAAGHRKEAREYLRSLGHGERAALLLGNADPLLLQAALEVPSALSGLTPELRADVEKSYATRVHGPELARLEERNEALTVISSTLTILGMEIRKDAGLASDHEFESWLWGTPG